MASALDPNRIATLKHRLELALAARRVGRAERQQAAIKGHATRQAKHGPTDGATA